MFTMNETHRLIEIGHSLLLRRAPVRSFEVYLAAVELSLDQLPPPQVPVLVTLFDEIIEAHISEDELAEEYRHVKTQLLRRPRTTPSFFFSPTLKAPA